MSVQIIEMLAPVIGSGARSGLRRTGFRGVTIHNTGNAAAGAGAKNHGTYLQNSGRVQQASWHYAVDEICATRSVPENEIAWHAGDGGNGDGNCKTIAIEICMNSDGNLLKATDNGAWLAADILRRNGITKAVSGVNLFQHNHWSGKNCPQMIRAGKPYDWNTFVAKVNAHLGATTTTTNTSTTSKEVYRVRKTWADAKSQKGAYSILDNAKKMCDKNPGYKVFNVKGEQVYPAVTAAKPTTSTTTKKTVDQLAQEVLAGKWGNGTARKTALEKAGYNYAAVQAKVDELVSGKKTTTKPATKTVDQLAKEVIDGKHGTGEARKKSLGARYAEVQARVNEILTGKKAPAAAPKMTARQFALEVWNKGMHGTGSVRKANAAKYGVDYAEAQRLLNILASGGKI